MSDNRSRIRLELIKEMEEVKQACDQAFVHYRLGTGKQPPSLFPAIADALIERGYINIRKE